MKQSIQIGDEVQDRISTDFTGIVTGVAEWSSGTQSCHVQAKELKDNKPQAIWIESGNLIVVKKQVFKTPTFPKPEFKFGDRLECTITGFTGVVQGISYWMQGCIKYTLISDTLGPLDGKCVEESFDAHHLKLVTEEAIPVPAKKTGGPQRSYPSP